MKMQRMMMSVSAGITIGVAMLALPHHARAGTQLFSAEDVAAWNKQMPQASPTFKSRDIGTRGVEADGAPSCRSIPKTDAPTSPSIDIVSPPMGKPLAAPVDINVKFVPAGADVIQPGTFRVCYFAMLMTVDITEKLAGKVAVSAEGLHVPSADLPSGHHHLMMLISDKSGHIGRREAIFDIK